MSEPILPLRLAFSQPDFGWIRLSFLDIPQISINCTFVDDPFPNMITWLETLVSGQSHAAWEVSEEGSSTHIFFASDSSFIGGYSDHLVLSRSSNFIWQVAGITTTRRAIVDGFYTAFRAMIEAPEYQGQHWHLPEAFYLPDVVNDPEAEDDNTFDGSFLPNLRSSLIETWLFEPKA